MAYACYRDQPIGTKDEVPMSRWVKESKPAQGARFAGVG